MPDRKSAAVVPFKGGNDITTGHPKIPELSLQRKLLAEYDPYLTLDKYMDYIQLKNIIKGIEQRIEVVRKETLAKRGPEDVKLDPEGIQCFRLAAAAVSADEEVTRLQDRFFEVLRKSYDTVKDYLHQADALAINKLNALKELSIELVRHAGKEHIVSIYITLQKLINYRRLNAELFGKILKKFMDRCAQYSLEVQHRCTFTDKKISQSTLCLPPFDISNKMDWIVSVYGITFKANFEQGMWFMKKAFSREIPLRHRIVSATDAHYFERRSAYHSSSRGKFAMQVIGGTTTKRLSKTVGVLLNTNPLSVKLGEYANGEVSVVFKEAIRGEDVFIVQSMNGQDGKPSLSTVIMELLLMLQTAQLASAARITAVVPFLAYSNKTVECSAIAEMMVLMGCRHVITVDMYNEQVEGFFPNIPVENISAKYEFITYIVHQLEHEGHDFKNIVVVAADSHTVARARAYADAIADFTRFREDQFVGVATAVRRVRNGKWGSGGESPLPRSLGSMTNLAASTFTDEIDITGDVEGKLCIIVDFVLDEGVNLTTIASRLMDMGAARIKAVCTHALFSGDAAQRVAASPIEEVIVSDSINQDHLLQDAQMAKKLRVLPIGPLIADAIERVHSENTLSTLFDQRK